MVVSTYVAIIDHNPNKVTYILYPASMNWVYVKATFSVRCKTFLSTFHNKLHNMKALDILSHNDHHFSHLLVSMKKKNFYESLWALLEYFRENKLLTAHSFNIGAHIGICAQISRNTLLYLPSLKRRHLSVVCVYFMKRESNFKHVKLTNIVLTWYMLITCWLHVDYMLITCWLKNQ